MYGILFSAFNAMLGWVFRGLVVKFVIFTILFMIVSSFISYIVSSNVLPNFANVQNMASSIPSSVAYLFGIFQIWTGVGMIITAYIARFMIRRIPIIG